jgi:putative colanic acid biosysnthesis UDP-glucose lipid carrier transferase
MKLRDSDLLFVSLFTDIALLNLAIFFMAWLNINLNQLSGHEIGYYLLQGNIILIASYFIYTPQNIYLSNGFWSEFIQISKQAVIVVAISGIISFFVLSNNFSREFIFQYCILFYIQKLVYHGCRHRYMEGKIEKENGSIRTLIIGINDTSKHLRKVIDNNQIFAYKFVGYVNNEPVENENILGKPDDIASLIEAHRTHVVFATVSIFNDNNKSLELLDICNSKGVRLWFVLENQRWLKPHVNTESFGDLILVNPQKIPLDDISARVQKRLFDIAFSSFVILFVFTWLFPLIALIIKLSSKGPVFFIQDRTGVNNKTFKCIKFRSMQVNAEAHERQTTYNDSRKTVIGHFLRRTNMDELPQFLNVFLGNMSVVGPRPHMLKHTIEYSKLIDYYLIRHFVKPGITGFAQVNGYRGETKQVVEMEKRVIYDRKYIEKWTLGWDIKIIWLTLFGKDVSRNAH